MFTKNDLSNDLINNSTSFYINILLDFLNNFYNTYKILSRKEILNRINRLEYIGFENRDNGYICDDDKSTFGEGFYYYVAVNKNVDNNDLIKAYTYHELIHCLSIHKENRKQINGFKSPFILNPIFDEIMTEFYAHTLLVKENINIQNTYIYEENSNYKLYSEYNGCGYHKYMGLAKIYDYIFNRNLLRGKFIDNNDLINEINNISFNNNLDIDYKEFINCDDPIKRYYDIALIFISKLKDTYNFNGNKEQIVNDEHINTFLDLILKEQDSFSTKPYKDIDVMIFNEIYKYLCSQNKIKII